MTRLQLVFTGGRETFNLGALSIMNGVLKARPPGTYLLIVLGYRSSCHSRLVCGALKGDFHKTQILQCAGAIKKNSYSEEWDI